MSKKLAKLTDKLSICKGKKNSYKKKLKELNDRLKARKASKFVRQKHGNYSRTDTSFSQTYQLDSSNLDISREYEQTKRDARQTD
jgi:hypothetical protein